jgi:hypothetical protein
VCERVQSAGACYLGGGCCKGLGSRAGIRGPFRWGRNSGAAGSTRLDRARFGRRNISSEGNFYCLCRFWLFSSNMPPAVEDAVRLGQIRLSSVGRVLVDFSTPISTSIQGSDTKGAPISPTFYRRNFEAQLSSSARYIQVSHALHDGSRKATEP